jgi:hypothetical protein
MKGCEAQRKQKQSEEVILNYKLVSYYDKHSGARIRLKTQLNKKIQHFTFFSEIHIAFKTPSA